MKKNKFKLNIDILIDNMNDITDFELIYHKTHDFLHKEVCYMYGKNNYTFLFIHKTKFDKILIEYIIDTEIIYNEDDTKALYRLITLSEVKITYYERKTIYQNNITDTKVFKGGYTK